MTHTISQSQKEKIVLELCRISFENFTKSFLVQYPEGNDTRSATLKGAISKAYRNLLADGII